MLRSHLNSIKLLLLATPVIFVTGCMPLYTQPVTGPTAQLGALDQRIFANEHRIWIFEDAINCKEGRTLFDFSHRLSGKPVPIRANRLTTLLDEYQPGGYSASDFAVSFYPQANERYFIKTTNYNDGFFRMKSSFQIVREIKDKTGKVSYIPVTFLRRNLQASFNYSACFDKDIQQKLKNVKNESLKELLR